MGLFGKLFGKKNDTPCETVMAVNRQSIFDGDKVEKDDWTQVLSACLGKMTAIQTACGDYVSKGRNWNVDFSRGVIIFGEDEYPIQFIGSESTISNTWLWGWENINGFNDSLIALPNEAKKRGEQWNLSALTMDKFDLDDNFNGHTLSAVACGISDGKYCYYRCQHNSGAAFVAISGVPEEVFAPVDMMKFVGITMQCIQEYPIDHRIFVESFLMWNGTQFDATENAIVAHFQQDINIEFEQAEDGWRISGIRS